MEENKEKKKKGKGLLIIILALIAAGGLTAAGLVFGPKLFKGKPVEPEEQTDEKVTLFWNVDREYYLIQNPTEAGLSSRKTQDDGYYHILFATENGRSAQRLVKDVRLMNRIDNNRCMALVTDEKGVVIDIKTIEDLGYEYVYDRYYVAEGDEKSFLLNSSSNYNGIEETIDITGDFLMIDVSGFDEAESIIGNQLPYLRAEDRVVGIKDDKGNLRNFYIIERTENTPTFTHYCEYCFKDVKWKGWNSDIALPTSAGHYDHYYLTKDINLTGAQVVKANTHICVDLNGHTVECAPDYRAYTFTNVTSGVALFDHSEGEKGVIKAHGSATGAGGLICISKGNFQLYSGTLDASDFTILSSGGAVYVAAEQSFKMYGGTIIGATAKGNRYITSEYKEASRGGVGGAVVVMGEFEMNGGTIRDAVAVGEAYKTASGTTAYCTTYGANIYVTKTGKVTMNGGVIEGGSVGMMGGNVALASSTDPKQQAVFIMNGGIIRNGKNTRDKYNGGNVAINAGSRFEMNGGEISGGVSRNCAGNVYVNGTFIMRGGLITNGVCMNNSTEAHPEASSANVFLVHPDNFTMTGGTITGQVYYIKQDNKGKVSFSGNPVIYGGIKTNLQVGNTMEIHAENMGAGAKIGITSSDFFTDVVNSNVIKSFVPDAKGESIAQYKGKLFIGNVRCQCGGCLEGKTIAGEKHVCEVEPFKAWNLTTSLPGDPGCYYLTDDVVLSTQGALTKAGRLSLDLNGHTITQTLDKHRIYIVNNDEGILTISDSKGTGKLIAAPNFTGEGGTLLSRRGDMVLYDVEVHGSDVGTQKGGIITVYDGAALEVYYGKMTGGKASQGGAIQANANSAIVIYGTEITGNVATRGGAIYNGGAIMSLNGPVNISGNGKTNAADDDSNLMVVGELPIVIVDPITGTVKLSDTRGDFAVGADGITEDMAAKFTSSLKDTLVSGHTETAGVIFSVESSLPKHVHCFCGGTEVPGHTHADDTLWQPLDDMNSLASLGSGYYYLTQDTSIDSAQLFNGKDITICLNGHKVTANARILIGNLSETRLALTDCAETKGSMDYIAGDECMIYLNKMAKMELFGVTLDGTNCTLKVPVINMYAKEGSGPSLKAYGSKIIAAPTCNRGGAVMSSAADATNAKLLSMEFVNTEMTGGNASLNGGAIYTCGNTTLTGCTITGNKTEGNGGALYGDANAVVTLEDTEITGNVATAGGAVYVLGQLTLKGDTTITGNGKTAAADNDSNLLAVTPVTVDATVTAEKSIGVSLTALGDFAASDNADADKVFVSDNEEYEIVKRTEGGKTILSLESAAPKHLHCICGGLKPEGHTCDETAEWSPIDNLSGLANLASGNYYLTADCTVTAQQLFNGKTINICLNGHTVTMKNRVLIGNTAETKLTITDCAEKKGSVEFITSAEGVFYIHKQGAIEIYGVDVNGANATAQTELIQMYATSGYGASLKVYNAKLTGTPKASNSSVINNTATSGNAALLNVELYNTEIVGGASGANGGAMSIYGKLKMEDCKITGASTTKNGGAIWGSQVSTLDLKNVEITGNTAYLGGGIYAEGKVNLSGKINVTGNGSEKAADNDSNIYVAETGSVTMAKDMTEGSAIGISMAKPGTFATINGFDSTNAMDQYLKDVTVVSDTEMQELSTKKDGSTLTISLKDLNVHTAHCICGGTLDGVTLTGTTHTCTDVTWTELTDTMLNAIDSQASGNYYLTKDLTLSKALLLNGKNIAICLNGHKLTVGTSSAQGRILLGNSDTATLTITDCRKKAGKIEVVNVNQAPFYLHNYGTVNLYNGTIDGSTMTGCNKVADTSVIHMGARSATAKPIGTFNMYGGTLVGANVEKLHKDAGIASADGKGNGAALHLLGYRTANMYGGTIRDGITDQGGGNVGIEANATFNMYGGVISGAKALKGANVYVSGTFNMKGGEVKDGVATTTTDGGGNMQVNSIGVANVENATFSGGQAAYGGNIRVTGKLTLKNSAITDGVSTKGGGGIHVNKHDNANLILVGKIVMENNKYNLASGAVVNDNLTLNADNTAAKMDFSGLSSDSKIGIRASESNLVDLAVGVPAGYENTVIYAESPSFTIVNNGGTIKFQKK